MLNVLLVLFIVIPTFPIQSMDLEKKDKLIKKSASFPFTNKTSTKNFNYTIKQAEHPFALAAGSNDVAIVKNYLANAYFNPNIHRYKTAIHVCAEKKHYDLLLLLITDPRIDTSIKNELHQTAHDVLKSKRVDERDQQFLLHLFGRLMLDITTNEVCSGLKKPFQDGLVTINVVADSTKMIKQKLLKIEDMQDNKLPTAARMPLYATDEFIMKKIWFILSLFDNEFVDEIKNQ